MDNILKIQEQTGKNLVQHQIEAESYNTLSPEQEQHELDNDEGYQEFLDKLDEVPF